MVRGRIRKCKYIYAAILVLSTVLYAYFLSLIHVPDGNVELNAAISTTELDAATITTAELTTRLLPPTLSATISTTLSLSLQTNTTSFSNLTSKNYPLGKETGLAPNAPAPYSKATIQSAIKPDPTLNQGNGSIFSTKEHLNQLGMALQTWKNEVKEVVKGATQPLYPKSFPPSRHQLHFKCHGQRTIAACYRETDLALKITNSQKSPRKFPNIDAYPVDKEQIDALAARAVQFELSSPLTLVLTAAGYNHLHLFLNWVAALESVMTSSPFEYSNRPGWGLVCLDKAMHMFLTSLSQNEFSACYYNMSSLPEKFDAFTGVGFMKATVVASLIRRGVSVVGQCRCFPFTSSKLSHLS